MYKVIVIADDFTGSNDTGVQLTKNGYNTITLLNPELLKRYEEEFDAVVLDTETRNSSSSEAYEILKQTAIDISEYKGALVYKKVDSTLRGNISAEIKALREILKPDVTLFAPAFPKNNRTTINGIHYLNGIPVNKTEIAKDPKKPIYTSDLKDIIRSKPSDAIGHIPIIKEVDILEKMLISELSKNEIVVIDAMEDSDLDNVCKVATSIDKTILWVGSAGLAEALMSVLQKSGENGHILTIAGSLSEVTIRQISEAITKEKNLKIINIDVKTTFSSKTSEVERAGSQAIKFMKDGYDVIVASGYEKDALKLANDVGAEYGLSSYEVSERIAEVLGDVATKILNEIPVNGLILTGGDTAIKVVKRLEISGCSIESEIETGIPLLKLLGGHFSGLKVVTKAGAFGKDNSLLNVINFLRDDNKRDL